MFNVVKSVLTLSSFLVVSAAFSAPVTVNNPGFETDVFADGGFNNLAPTDWIKSPATTGGVFNPTSGHITGEAPEGENTAYLNTDTGSFSQVLAENLQVVTAYTLNVDVCDRSDNPTPGYLIELLAGTTVIASDASTLVPNDGCLTSTISYTSATSDPNLGSPLEIRLTKIGGGQINFDNVLLDATIVDVENVPTLSEWMLFLLIISLMGLGVQSSRRSS